MKKISLFILLFAALSSYGQSDSTERVMEVFIYNGDTLYLKSLTPVEIFSSRTLTKQEQKQYDKLYRHVLKVYPYAKLAGIKLQEYEQVYDSLPNDKARKKYMKQAEDELWDSYSGELKKLTYTQGQILLKLLDRETGRTSHVLLQQLRGKFRTFFYQGFAKLWGYNLKTGYDPNGDDWMIEYIVQKIERGEI
ncbi:DUF4294 domain-containing protein [Bacteroidales bacterium OttesenSCG-928-J16]|nr:DUF4294 domain-containing protein [Bacteroidales bacterium OttesenSCG-928-J16]